MGDRAKHKGIGMSKVWLITGACGGIGAATARTALRLGDRVAVTGCNIEELRGALSDVAGDRLLVIGPNACDQAAADEAVRLTRQVFGRLDILLNNAGRGVVGAFEELTNSDIERVMASKLYSVMYTMRSALRTMREQRSGRIINVTSLAGLIGLEGCSAHSAAEFAIEGFSQAVARELEPSEIRITTVALGFSPASLSDSSSLDTEQPSTVVEENFAFALANDYLREDNLAELSYALLTIAEMSSPPRHFVADHNVFNTYKPILIGRLDELRMNEALTKSTGGIFPVEL